MLEGIRRLPPRDQQRLRDTLNALLPGTREDSRTAIGEALDQRLLASGLIERLPTPMTDGAPHAVRRLIEVSGKPVSETIIEERR